MSARTIRVELNVRTLLAAVAVIFAVWLVLQLWPILLVIVAALMFVGAMNPLVERLERRGMSRGWGIALVFLSITGVLGAFLAFTLPAFVTQISSFVEQFPEKQAALADRLEQSRMTASLAQSIRQTNAADMMTKAEQAAIAYGPRGVTLAAYFFSAIFLALYLLVDRDRMRGALFAVTPRHYHVRLSRILLNLETIVGGYVRGQLITSAMMAAFTFVVLTVAGVPNALALSLFAGLSDALPYVGAFLACGPATLAALSAHGATTAVVVLAVLAAYQELESRLIVPRVYGKVLRLPAAVVLVALLVGAKLLGIVGALLSLPIAAAIRMLVEELRVALPGEDVDVTSARRRDEHAEHAFRQRAAGAPAIEAAAIALAIAEERRHQDAVDPADAARAPITSGRLETRET